MAERKNGAIVYWRSLSPKLAIFRLRPEDESSFPSYKPGQYMALRRDNCKLTKRVTDPDGNVSYVPDLDENGKQKYGPVTHSYSISSAPFETLQEGYLEFYIILEKTPRGEYGRFTGSLFYEQPPEDLTLTYFNRITGDFTLDKRASGFRSVLLLGTGTGLAPFRAMIKQLHFEALQGKRDDVQYTLLHTNRTLGELAYHDELYAFEASQAFDFVYVPSVSRPAQQDLNDPGMGKGRASNLLRALFEMPMKEEQDLENAIASGGDVATRQAALERTIRPVLPVKHSPRELRERLHPAHTVILTCGNPLAMADVQAIADVNRLRFEKEDW